MQNPVFEDRAEVLFWDDELEVKEPEKNWEHQLVSSWMSGIMEMVNITLGFIMYFLVRYCNQRKEVNNYIV